MPALELPGPTGHRWPPGVGRRAPGTGTRSCSVCSIRIVRGPRLSSPPHGARCSKTKVRAIDGITRDGLVLFGWDKRLAGARQENLPLELREIVQDLLGVGLQCGRVGPR